MLSLHNFLHPESILRSNISLDYSKVFDLQNDDSLFPLRHLHNQASRYAGRVNKNFGLNPLVTSSKVNTSLTVDQLIAKMAQQEVNSRLKSPFENEVLVSLMSSFGSSYLKSIQSDIYVQCEDLADLPLIVAIEEQVSKVARSVVTTLLIILFIFTFLT